MVRALLSLVGCLATMTALAGDQPRDTIHTFQESVFARGCTPDFTLCIDVGAEDFSFGPVSDASTAGFAVSGPDGFVAICNVDTQPAADFVTATKQRGTIAFTTTGDGFNCPAGQSIRVVCEPQPNKASLVSNGKKSAKVETELGTFDEDSVSLRVVHPVCTIEGLSHTLTTVSNSSSGVSNVYQSETGRIKNTDAVGW